MAEIKEKIRNTWLALVYPDGVDEEYDCQCDDAFLKFLDKVVIFSWGFYGVVASISIYFFVTRELL